MFDYLKKKYSELVASVLDPVFQWLLALSWLKRTALVVVIPLSWTVWETRAQLSEHILVLNQARKILISERSTIPISDETSRQLTRLAERLRIAADAERHGDARLVVHRRRRIAEHLER